jgi:hypothetical protein
VSAVTLADYTESLVKVGYDSWVVCRLELWNTYIVIWHKHAMYVYQTLGLICKFTIVGYIYACQINVRLGGEVCMRVCLYVFCVCMYVCVICEVSMRDSIRIYLTWSTVVKIIMGVCKQLVISVKAECVTSNTMQSFPLDGPYIGYIYYIIFIHIH